VFGQDAYATTHEKAAAMLHSLVRNHALVDGNKRLGWAATETFLLLNGYEVVASDDELFDLVIAVADGSASEVAKIAARLAAVSRSL
jgi:death on curing protein